MQYIFDRSAQDEPVSGKHGPPNGCAAHFFVVRRRTSSFVCETAPNF